MVLQRLHGREILPTFLICGLRQREQQCTSRSLTTKPKARDEEVRAPEAVNTDHQQQLPSAEPVQTQQRQSPARTGENPTAGSAMTFDPGMEKPPSPLSPPGLRRWCTTGYEKNLYLLSPVLAMRCYLQFLRSTRNGLREVQSQGDGEEGGGRYR